MSAPAPLDTRVDVETPEGVHLHLLPAGIIPRGLAWSLDLVIRLAILFALASSLLTLGPGGAGLYLIGLFVLLWFYPVLFELFWGGQTPGKRMLGLRVVMADGAPVGWLASVTRNLVRTVDMLPVGYGVGIVSSLLDGSGRRLGDIAAGTLVVHAHEQRQRVMPPRVPAVDPPPGLRAPEREALVEFAERAAELAPARQEELAGIMAPVTGRANGEGVRHLLGMAVGLMGEGRGAR